MADHEHFTEVKADPARAEALGLRLIRAIHYEDHGAPNTGRAPTTPVGD